MTDILSASSGLLLIAVPGLPLLFALCALLLKNIDRVVRIAPWGTAPGLACGFSISLDSHFDLPWMMMGSNLTADELGAPVLFVTSAVWLFGALQTIRTEGRYSRLFSACFYLAMAGNMGVLVAADMLSFYLFFALMSFAAYGLIIENATTRTSRAGRIYMALVIVGEISLFAGIALLAASIGTTELTQIATRPLSQSAALLLVVGFGIKAGLVPLHFSLPLVYSSAPAPARFVLAGAMLNAGVFGWLRFLPMDAAMLPGWGDVLIVVGAISVFYGVACGLAQSDARALLAYSSISQIGYVIMLLGLGLALPDNGALIHGAIVLFAVHHGLAKAALFWGWDIWVQSEGKRVDRAIAGAGLLLAAIALCGAPFTSGALSKAAMTIALSPLQEQQTWFYTYFMPFGAIGTTLLMARLFLLCHGHKETAATPATQAAFLYMGLMGLLAVTAWFFAPDYLDYSSLHTPSKLWAGLWPILAGIGGFIVGRLVCRAVAKGYSFVIPAGDIVVLLEQGMAGCRVVYGAASRTAGKTCSDAMERSGYRVRRLLISMPAQALPWRSATTGAIMLAVLFILMGLVIFEG